MVRSRRVARIDEDSGSVRDLLHGGAARGDDGHTACHRLQNWNPEALVERRVRNTSRAAVETRELCVVDLPEPANTVPADFDPTPAARSDDTQLTVCAADGLHKPVEVLPRFERSDGKDIVPVLGRAFVREVVADGVRNDANLVVRHSEQLDELTPCELGHRDHPLRRAKDARHHTRTVAPRPAVERLRVPEHGEVVHGDDQGNARAQRAAVRRTMQDVGGAFPSDQERVPDPVARQRRQAVLSSERASCDRHVVAPLELAHQPFQITRRSRTSLSERGDVDRDAHHSASA